MKTGIELIAQERAEQKEKHGFSNDYQKNHPEYYEKQELAIAAREMLNTQPGIESFPESWDNHDMIKRMVAKSYKERLIIAGALIAAEIDRVQSLESAADATIPPEKNFPKLKFGFGDIVILRGNLVGIVLSGAPMFKDGTGVIYQVVVDAKECAYRVANVSNMDQRGDKSLLAEDMHELLWTPNKTLITLERSAEDIEFFNDFMDHKEPEDQ